MRAVCFVCGARNATQRIPQDPTLAGMWKKSLGMSNGPPNARICRRHFDDSDFYQTRTGKVKVRDGCVPRQSPNLGPNRARNDDHTYSFLSKSSDSEQWVFLAAVLGVWLPILLMVFCYCVSQEDDRRRPAARDIIRPQYPGVQQVVSGKI